MCRPEHFRVDYAINPWMDLSAPVDAALALDQWEALRDAVEAAGASVEVIAGLADNPDMVYAMNFGLVDGDAVVVTNFRHRQRRAEADAAATWFAAQGFRVHRLDGPSAFEAGDAFLLGDALVVAHGPRTDLSAHREISATLGVRITPIRVVHPALYHLDLSLCPLDERRALIAPSAWDAAGAAVVRALVPEPLVLSEAEAFTFCANSIVVGDTVIMPACPGRVRRQLEAWGFHVVLVDVSELHRGGGSIRCMTLPLDTEFSAARLAQAA
jgi:N-dimethylarginine dimethylaminohydrolase